MPRRIPDDQCQEILNLSRFFARKMCVQWKDRDDIAQETFMLLMRNRSTDLTRPNVFRTRAVWCMTCNAIRNILGVPRLSRFKTRAAEVPLLSDGDDNALAVYDASLKEIDDAETVAAVLLSVGKRTGMMILARSQGMRFAEIGALFGTSKQRVHQLIKRASEQPHVQFAAGIVSR